MHRVDNYMKKASIDIIDDLPAAVLFTDSSNNVIYANSSFMTSFGVQNADVVGRPCWDQMSPGESRFGEYTDQIDEHIKVNIGGETYNIIVSGKSVGKELILRVIQDISKVLCELVDMRSKIAALENQVNKLIAERHLVVLCAVCSKVRISESTWISPAAEVELLARKDLSHGFCPDCAKEYLKRELGSDTIEEDS